MENKPKKAAVLSYHEGMRAPEIVASGTGYIAENIVREGKAHDIPVYKDEKLATLLTELQIGEQIPEALYEVVAEILVFVSDLDELYAKAKKPSK